jgi:hypothetical protein
VGVSIAARITFGFEGVGIGFVAAGQPADQSPTVRTSAGSSTVSSALPTRSRTQEKYTFIPILLDEVMDSGASNPSRCRW